MDRRSWFGRLGLALAFLAAVLPGLAWASGPGTYRIKGFDPRNRSEYSGTAQLTRTSDNTWRIVWRIGGQAWNGHGIGDGKVIAVNYSGQGVTGVFLMIAREGGGYEAIWGYTGERTVGTEEWSRSGN
jgi:hypothetical protein